MFVFKYKIHSKIHPVMNKKNMAESKNYIEKR